MTFTNIFPFQKVTTITCTLHLPKLVHLKVHSIICYTGSTVSNNCCLHLQGSYSSTMTQGECSSNSIQYAQHSLFSSQLYKQFPHTQLLSHQCNKSPQIINIPTRKKSIFIFRQMPHVNTSILNIRIFLYFGSHHQMNLDTSVLPDFNFLTMTIRTPNRC